MYAGLEDIEETDEERILDDGESVSNRNRDNRCDWFCYFVDYELVLEIYLLNHNNLY